MLQLAKPVAALAAASLLSGCLAAGSGTNSNKSYVTKLTPGEENDSVISQACSFDGTAIAAFGVAALTIALRGDAGDAAAAGLAAGVVANALSVEACNQARAAARSAMASTNKKVTWSNPASKSRGYSIVEPVKNNSKYGKRIDVVWQNGKQVSSSVSVMRSSSGRWVTT